MCRLTRRRCTIAGSGESFDSFAPLRGHSPCQRPADGWGDGDFSNADDPLNLPLGAEILGQGQRLQGFAELQAGMSQMSVSRNTYNDAPICYHVTELCSLRRAAGA
jgi:hypothetical protein